ncbi:COG2426 family protein [Anoxynatronum buryatiense]|uniref:Uncharacterized membrane protein n=1 Tax=Anoxynatronum buryatiense TaxID=489973 RepID=A0AA45WWS5_9CLOT|nr:small multi-drug export protein [Anoxynatronum buryatiense]SMP55298.1 Uncharacterized membrane protein [Anoxynatronum buryatiense]
MEHLFTWIRNEFLVFFMAALPIIELRGAIPFGLSLGFSPWHAFFISLAGSLLPVPFIVFGIRPVFDMLSRLHPLLDRLIHGLTSRTMAKGERARRFGFIGLIFLVAIPLPGTGVWTGSLAAVLLNLRFKLAFPAIFIGNVIAGLLVLSGSTGLLRLFQS